MPTKRDDEGARGSPAATASHPGGVRAEGAEELRITAQDARGSRAQLLARITALEGDLDRLALERDELRWHVHALQQARHALEASRERYADLYDFAPNGYLALDARGIVLDINLTGAELLGLPRPAIVGMPLYTWVVADDRRRLRDHLRRCRDATEPVSTEIDLDLRREGADVPVELVSAAQQDASGQVIYRTVVVDLTERRRAETDRQRLDLEKQRAEMANEAKARFLGVLSHELRTPLTPILAAASELEAAESLPAELRAVVGMIRRNAELEARLIDDLLDVTRIDRDKLEIRREPLDVHEVLHSVLEICAAEILQAGLELDVRLESPRSIVSGDRTRLHQVFWNLLINATRHTPPGGRVGLHTERVDRTLHVRISDTGEGMERTTLERVFLPFEQAVRGQRGGLGLGLTISQGLVNAHGGALSAESAGPGRGATFDVTLPLLERPPSRTTPMKIRAARPLQSGTVLLVEDHPDSAEMLCRMLTRAGYTVRVAHTVLEARETMAPDVDVIVSDIGLPDGSGLELVGQLQKIKPVAAVALSGFGADADRRASREAGFAAHLTKPVTYGDLVDAVEQARAAG